MLILNKKEAHQLFRSSCLVFSCHQYKAVSRFTVTLPLYIRCAKTRDSQVAAGTKLYEVMSNICGS